MRSETERLFELLETRLGAKTKRPVVTLQMNHGEDCGLIEEAWRSQHQYEAEPECFVLLRIFSEPPRLDLASAESVLKALPYVKAFFRQSPDDAIEAQWRAAAQCAGAVYDDIRPVRPGYQHANDRWQ